MTLAVLMFPTRKILGLEKAPSSLSTMIYSYKDIPTKLSVTTIAQGRCETGQATEYHIQCRPLTKSYKIIYD